MNKSNSYIVHCSFRTYFCIVILPNLSYVRFTLNNSPLVETKIYCISLVCYFLSSGKLFLHIFSILGSFFQFDKKTYQWDKVPQIDSSDSRNRHLDKFHSNSSFPQLLWTLTKYLVNKIHKNET